MIFFFQLLGAGALSLLIGLSSANYAIERGLGFAAVKRGSWVSWTRAGTQNSDPYTDAVFAHSGELPPIGESVLVFSASTDDLGQALRAGCDYRIGGTAPPAQYWTFVAYNAATGKTLVPEDKRSGFSSAEIIYRVDGSFEIAMSQEPQPANWSALPGTISSETPVRMFLRLYDTPVSFGRDLAQAELPRIVRERCRT